MPVRRQRQLTILFLAANPRSTERVEVDREIRGIEERLRGSRGGRSFSLVSRWAVRPEDLQQALLEVEPDVIHFSMHGTRGGELLLDDGAGGAAPLTGEALAGLFAAFQGKTQVVVFNACRSLPHAEALKEHVACAVGMAHEIHDSAAIEFSAAFYQALGFGRSVQEAFDLAVNALLLHDLPDDAAAPRLVVRPELRTQPLFVLDGAAESQAPPPAPDPRRRSHLPALLLAAFLIACIATAVMTLSQPGSPRSGQPDVQLPPDGGAPVTAASAARR